MDERATHRLHELYTRLDPDKIDSMWDWKAAIADTRAALRELLSTLGAHEATPPWERNDARAGQPWVEALGEGAGAGGLGGGAPAGGEGGPGGDAAARPGQPPTT